MDSLGGQSHATALSAVRILKRWWWIVLLTTVAVAGGRVLSGSRRQDALYSSSAQVLLKYQNLASGLTGIQDLSTVYQDPQRIAQTQTQIAMSPDVAERVVEAAEIPGLDASTFLGSALVTAATDSDILDFNITYGDARDAPRSSRRCTRGEFIAHRRELDTASLVAARKELRGRIDELEQTEFRGSPLVARLVESEQQLRTMEALQTANASLLRPADGAAQIQPQREARTPCSASMLGLMLGIGLAFARDAFDTRVRSAGEVSDRLGTPLLARIQAPPRKLRRSNRLVMIASPTRRSRRGVPDAARQSRVREPRPRRALDPGHERARAGGQVDHRRQPRRGAGTRRTESRSRRPRPPPSGARGSSRSRAPIRA